MKVWTLLTLDGEAMVEYRNTLNHVEYQNLSPELEERAGKIVDSIKVGLGELKIEPLFLDTPTFVSEDGSVGVAFAVDKLDRGFMETLKSGSFRYRDDLVQEKLNQVVEKFDLLAVVDWDRGMGVFVYNLFFKE